MGLKSRSVHPLIHFLQRESYDWEDFYLQDDKWSLVASPEILFFMWCYWRYAAQLGVGLAPEVTPPPPEPLPPSLGGFSTVQRPGDSATWGTKVGKATGCH